MGMDDKIHQPYRFKLVKEYNTLKEELKKFNKKLVLSGAGPSLITLTFSYKKALEILKNLENNLKNKIDGKLMVLKVNNEGIKIENL